MGGQRASQTSNIMTGVTVTHPPKGGGRQGGSRKLRSKSGTTTTKLRGEAGSTVESDGEETRKRSSKKTATRDKINGKGVDGRLNGGRAGRPSEGSATGGVSAVSAKEPNAQLNLADSPPMPELLTRYIPRDPLPSRVTAMCLSPMPTGAKSSALAAKALQNDSLTHGQAGVGRGAMRGSTLGADRGPGRGLAGLRNLGNTCYLNASLQVLGRCSMFRSHLVECVSGDATAGRPSPLAFAMSKMYKSMELESQHSNTGVEGVLNALVKGNPWFGSQGQHDAHEATRAILDLLHQELCRQVPVSFEPGHTAMSSVTSGSNSNSSNNSGNKRGDSCGDPRFPPPTPSERTASTSASTSTSTMNTKAATPCTPLGEPRWGAEDDDDGSGGQGQGR
ncbi:unnamed protein product, partial [Discosporangium mesarthrocarpum]